MASYVVRIDAAFTYEVEADSAEEARANAETQFENGEYGDNRVTETLVFEEDGFTIAEDEPETEEIDCGQCAGTGRTQSASNGEDEECPVCDGTGSIEEEVG